MQKKLISLALMALFLLPMGSVCSALQSENVIWTIKANETNYMKYYGKRVVDVNRSEADRLIPQEFGWQGNQLIFIFHLTSKQLREKEFDFTFEIKSKDYDQDTIVELDVYAGTNINNLKTVRQGIKIIKTGTYTVPIPSGYFYLGNQNFIKLYGSNVRPIGYGENPPNCRFQDFKLSIPGSDEKYDGVNLAAADNQKAMVEAYSAPKLPPVKLDQPEIVGVRSTLVFKEWSRDKDHAADAEEQDDANSLGPRLPLGSK